MSIPPQVGNWTEYKGGMPPDPPPIGRLPMGANPRFPTIGASAPRIPQGGYQSIISTRPPIDAGMAKRVANAYTPYQSNQQTAGNQSRSALSRALLDTTKGAVGRAGDDFNQQYRQQAEKSRAEDILSQRQNAADRFQMESARDVFGADESNRYSEGIKDLRQYFVTEKRNEQAKRTAIVMRFLGSLL